MVQCIPPPESVWSSTLFVADMDLASAIDFSVFKFFTLATLLLKADIIAFFRRPSVLLEANKFVGFKVMFVMEEFNGIPSPSSEKYLLVV